MKTTVTLSNEQWAALARAAHVGVLAADMLGAAEQCFRISERETQDAHDALQSVADALRAQILGHRPRAPIAMEAASFDTEQANREGWNLDFSDRLDEWSVVDVDGHFGSDAAALAAVTHKAMQGSAYHEAAVDWLNMQNALHSAAQSIQPCATFEVTT